jgi:hypothetical protein
MLHLVFTRKSVYFWVLLFSSVFYSCGNQREYRVLGERGSWEVLSNHKPSQKHVRTDASGMNRVVMNSTEEHPIAMLDSLKRNKSKQLKTNMEESAFRMDVPAMVSRKDLGNVRLHKNSNLKSSKNSKFVSISKEFPSDSKIKHSLSRPASKKAVSTDKKSWSFIQKMKHYLKNKFLNYIPSKDDDHRYDFMVWGLLFSGMLTIFILGFTNYAHVLDVSIIISIVLWFVSLFGWLDDNTEASATLAFILTSLCLGVLGLVSMLMLLTGELAFGEGGVFGFWGFMFMIFLIVMWLIYINDPDFFG